MYVNVPWRAQSAEGMPAARRVEYGDQFCSWVCNIDIVFDIDDDDVVYSESMQLAALSLVNEDEDVAYADTNQPPNPKLIFTNSSANATYCLFVFGLMYRFDNRGIIAQFNASNSRYTIDIGVNSVPLLLSELLDDSLMAEEYTDNVPPRIATGATILRCDATCGQ